MYLTVALHVGLFITNSKTHEGLVFDFAFSQRHSYFFPAGLCIYSKKMQARPTGSVHAVIKT